MIRNPNFDAEEKKWFALLLGIPFQYRELFYHQIETAEIHRDYSDRCLILNLYPPTGSQRLPDLGTRVPINMIIQHIAKPALTKGKVLFQERYSMECLQGDTGEWPTEFLLHVKDGLVHTLEIFNVDGSVLCKDRLCIGRVDYSLHPSLAPIEKA